jgi:branched-chain amino acid transport system permease protein
VTPKEVRNIILAVVLFAVAALLPLTDSGYWISLGVTIAMYTVLSTSWALFSGPTRYISLASAAFFGIGMYLVGGFVEKLPFPLLVLMAALAGALLAAVVGLATLRISGVYFVIFTLGLSELTRQIMTWVQTTMGASSGLYVLTDATEQIIYWQLLVIAAVVYLLGWWIARSRLGFALRIIGNDEVVASHCGINTARAKVILFVISGAFAALTGAVLAPRWTYVEPSLAFSPMISFQVAIMALLGGMHRLWGPILGVIPFTLLWDLISAKFPNQTSLLLGVAFLIIVYFIPNGVAGILENITQRRHQSARVDNGK